MSEGTRLRLIVTSVVVGLGATAFVFQDALPGRFRGVLGIVCFIGIVVMFSSNISAINWRTVGWGLALQVMFAILILRFEGGDVRPGYALFAGAATVVTQFLSFTDVGLSLIHISEPTRPY